jgi:hypothetical protein
MFVPPSEGFVCFSRALVLYAILQTGIATELLTAPALRFGAYAV